MNEIKNLKPGTYFTMGGSCYQLVRDPNRQSQQPCRNQWGRAEGGTYTADVFVVKINRRHRGMWTKYIAFPVGCKVSVATEDRFLNPPSIY